jgi:hypothetical protein
LLSSLAALPVLAAGGSAAPRPLVGGAVPEPGAAEPWPLTPLLLRSAAPLLSGATPGDVALGGMAGPLALPLPFTRRAVESSPAAAGPAWSGPAGGPAVLASPAAESWTPAPAPSVSLAPSLSLSAAPDLAVPPAVLPDLPDLVAQRWITQPPATAALLDEPAPLPLLARRPASEGAGSFATGAALVADDAGTSGALPSAREGTTPRWPGAPWAAPALFDQATPLPMLLRDRDALVPAGTDPGSPATGLPAAPALSTLVAQRWLAQPTAATATADTPAPALARRASVPAPSADAPQPLPTSDRPAAVNLPTLVTERWLGAPSAPAPMLEQPVLLPLLASRPTPAAASASAATTASVADLERGSAPVAGLPPAQPSTTPEAAEAFPLVARSVAPSAATGAGQPDADDIVMSMLPSRLAQRWLADLPAATAADRPTPLPLLARRQTAEATRSESTERPPAATWPALLSPAASAALAGSEAVRLAASIAPAALPPDAVPADGGPAPLPLLARHQAPGTPLVTPGQPVSDAWPAIIDPATSATLAAWSAATPAPAGLPETTGQPAVADRPAPLPLLARQLVADASSSAPEQPVSSTWPAILSPTTSATLATVPTTVGVAAELPVAGGQPAPLPLIARQPGVDAASGAPEQPVSSTWPAILNPAASTTLARHDEVNAMLARHDEVSATLARIDAASQPFAAPTVAAAAREDSLLSLASPRTMLARRGTGDDDAGQPLGIARSDTLLSDTGRSDTLLSLTPVASIMQPPPLRTAEMVARQRAEGSGGDPLPLPVRAPFERLFNTSFADVAVYTDSAAAEATSAAGAAALTIGPRIFFAPGRFQPEEPEGSALLAHELTHVVQQRTDPLRMALKSLGSVVAPEASAAESEAEATEAQVRDLHRGGAFPAQPLTLARAVTPGSNAAVASDPASDFLGGTSISGPALGTSDAPALARVTRADSPPEERSSATPGETGALGEAAPGANTPQDPFGAVPAASVNLLADRVYDLIKRRLLTEKERVGRWL